MALEVIKSNDDHPAWKLLYDNIKNSPVDTMFNWVRLQSITGIDCKRCRDVIYRANQELIKNRKNILVSVRNQGYRICCNDTQIAHASGHKRKASSQLKLCKNELSGIDPKTLSVEKRKDLILFMNHVNTSLNVIESNAIDGIEKTKIVIQNQEDNLTAIRKMQAELINLEKRISG